MWQVLHSDREINHLDGLQCEIGCVSFLRIVKCFSEDEDENDGENVEEDDEDAQLVLLELLFFVERVLDLR